MVNQVNLQQSGDQLCFFKKTPVKNVDKFVCSDYLTEVQGRSNYFLFCLLQVSEAKTPVSTPIPSPPPAQSSPASISTPEPSIQEPEVSQNTLVPTPTPSIVVKTPTPEPEPEPELSM